MDTSQHSKKGTQLHTVYLSYSLLCYTEAAFTVFVFSFLGAL